MAIRGGIPAMGRRMRSIAQKIRVRSSNQQGGRSENGDPGVARFVRAFTPTPHSRRIYAAVISGLLLILAVACESGPGSSDEYAETGTYQAVIDLPTLTNDATAADSDTLTSRLGSIGTVVEGISAAAASAAVVATASPEPIRLALSDDEFDLSSDGISSRNRHLLDTLASDLISDGPLDPDLVMTGLLPTIDELQEQRDPLPTATPPSGSDSEIFIDLPGFEDLDLSGIRLDDGIVDEVDEGDDSVDPDQGELEPADLVQDQPEPASDEDDDPVVLTDEDLESDLSSNVPANDQDDSGAGSGSTGGGSASSGVPLGGGNWEADAGPGNSGDQGTGSDPSDNNGKDHEPDEQGTPGNSSGSNGNANTDAQPDADPEDAHGKSGDSNGKGKTDDESDAEPEDSPGKSGGPKGKDKTDDEADAEPEDAPGNSGGPKGKDK
ncbi:MAG: hypothetical protein HOB07_08855, partial [Chloroflexi bacterium]|nr:hypothetical protein [Chloroflexota bacterium]